MKVESEVNEKLEDHFDCEGFLADKEFWSRETAENLAKLNDIGEHRLSENHWLVINYVRDYYDKHGTGPAVVRVAKQTGLMANITLCRKQNLPCFFQKLGPSESLCIHGRVQLI